MVKFGDPNMEIKRDDPERRKSFRARHQCDTNPGPKYKARYWSCRQWEAGKKVEAELESDASLIEIYPDLLTVEIVEDMDWIFSFCGLVSHNESFINIRFFYRSTPWWSSN